MMSDRERAGRILRVFSCALALLAVPATSAAAAPDRDPLPHLDAIDASGSPLDMRAAAFGQRGTELVLRITTEGEWDTSQLSAAEGRALCIEAVLRQAADAARPGLRLRRRRPTRPALTYARLDPFGGTVATASSMPS